MEHSDNFFTEEQINNAKLIELPLSDIEDMLDSYVYFKGMLEVDDGEYKFVDGFFILKSTSCFSYEFTPEEIEQDLHLAEADYPDTILIEKITGSEYSNNPLLIGKTYKLKKPKELNEIYFSYKQLCDVCSKTGMPLPNNNANLTKIKFNYDANLVNKKSYFNLYEAAKIASNISLESGFFSDTSYQLNLESISDCVKGQHESGFHLLTKELWTTGNDEFGEAYSKQYENGTLLKVSAQLDLGLTLISKAELIRWCDFMKIDTALKLNTNNFNKSIEALELEVQKLEDEIDKVTESYLSDLAKLNKKIETLESNNETKVEYPQELQIAIDAYNNLIVNKENVPTADTIKNWLAKESAERGIEHTADATKHLKGLSEKKKEVIASIIRP